MHSLFKHAQTLFFLVLATSAFADTVPVTVTCSNGMKVPNLAVSVIDSLGQTVADVQPTNSLGQFTIEDSELYTAPFYMWFRTKSGSICGSYYIYIDQDDAGWVHLNYYPTELPCSCSKLVH